MINRFTEIQDIIIKPKLPIPKKYWCINRKGEISERYFRFYIINEWGLIHYKSKDKNVIPEYAVFKTKQEAINYKKDQEKDIEKEQS